MARGGLPCRRQIVKAVPMNPGGPASEEICRPLQSPGLHFFRSKGRYSDFGNPHWNINHCFDFGDLVRPLLDLPEIPIEWKAMHGNGIDMLEHAAGLHAFHE